MLKALGYAPGRTDGYFDAATEKALKDFQRNEGLPVTGRTDEATADQLEQRMRDMIADPANDRQLNRALDALRVRIGLAPADGGTAEAESVSGIQAPADKTRTEEE
jgi:carboxyl-terminal processing protease